MADDDKSIIYVTMHNDSMANTYLTPGLFAALCEGDRQDSKDVTNLMIKVKQAAYNNLSERLESVMHKYMTLLTFASQEVDRSENTNQRDGLRSQHSAAQASQSKDSRLVSTNLSSHRIADDTSTQHGQTGRWSTTSKGEPRANSSHLGRRMSDVDQRKLTDREMKSFLTEKDDLMNLYPQLKDMESSR